MDSRGRVVGINTAIVALGQGLGLAVPATTGEWVFREILTHGVVRRRQLGITATVAPLSRRNIVRWDLLGATGVEIQSVTPGGAAQQGGLIAGDIIVSMADRVVETTDDLHRLLATVAPGQPISLQALRDDELISREIR